MVFIHGGGWYSGSVQTHDILCRRLSLITGSLLYSLDYHLAPEYKFPYQINEINEFIHYINAYYKDKDIILIGDSAGGNLAAALSNYNGKAGNHDLIAAQVLLYPVLTLSMETKSKMSNTFPSLQSMQEQTEIYLNNSDEINDYLASPLDTDDFINIPKTLIITGGKDTLCDEGKIYFDKITNNKANEYYNYESMGHGFLQFFKNEDNISSALDALDKINNFIHNRVN